MRGADRSVAKIMEIKVPEASGNPVPDDPPEWGRKSYAMSELVSPPTKRGKPHVKSCHRVEPLSEGVCTEFDAMISVAVP